MMGLQAASLFGVIDLQDNFTSGVRAARNSLDGLSSHLGSMGGKLQSFGAQATLYTAPLAAGLGVAAKAAIDFEYQFADVIKTVDATDQQLADLNATIRTMATDNSNPLSSLDNAHATLAEIMSLGGQLGVATENLESFTQHIGALDVASNLNADEAATQLAQFSNVVQMAPEHYGNFASALVRLGNNLASTEADMMNMTSRIASAGSMAGLSEVQILGFAGAMSSLGINAELGGGNFSKFIMTMQTGVAEAGDDLTTFAETAGMTVDDFAAAWETDAAGAITKFLEGLGELDAASQLGVMKDLELNGVEVQRVILSLAGSTGLLTDALELSAAGWEAGNDHLEEAASKAETTQGMLNMLQNQATDLSIELGNALLPAIVGLVDNISPLLLQLTDWMADNPELLSQILLITGALVVAGPVITMVGTVMSVTSATIGTATTVITIAKGAVAALGGGMMAAVGPIIAVGTAIAGVVATVLEFNRVTNQAAQEAHQAYQSSGMNREDMEALVFDKAVEGFGGGFFGDLKARVFHHNLVQGVETGEFHLIDGRATGGPVMGGTPYLVGEQGPELFIPSSGGQIINAQQTAAMAGGIQIGSIVIHANSEAEGREAARGFQAQMDELLTARG